MFAWWVAYAGQLIGLVCNTFISILSFAMIWVLYRRKRFNGLPKRVRYSLVLLAIYKPIQTGFSVYNIYWYPSYMAILYSGYIYSAFVSNGKALWICF